MHRTQIQLPDKLHAAAQDLASRKEISLSELIRRGLEYMLEVSPGTDAKAGAWEIPEAADLQSSDVFTDENWRANLHLDRLQAAEDSACYGDEENQP